MYIRQHWTQEQLRRMVLRLNDLNRMEADAYKRKGKGKNGETKQLSEADVLNDPRWQKG